MSIGMVAYLILHWQKLDKDCIYTRGPVVFVYVYMGSDVYDPLRGLMNKRFVYKGV